MRSVPTVGVFDSGVGGLSVLKACTETLPAAKFYYYGDNERAPYGGRPKEEIAQFTAEALSVFAALGVDAAVIACNTATAACIEEMRARFGFPVVGVEPPVALAAKRFDRAAVLATPFTAQSDRLKALIARFPQTRFEVIALPHLAEAVERALRWGAPLSLAEHLPPGGDFPCAVLGCTHYWLIRRAIARFWGVEVFDGAQGVANRLREEIEKIGIGVHVWPHLGVNECFTTKCNKNTKNRAIFLGNCSRINKNLFISNVCFNNF